MTLGAVQETESGNAAPRQGQVFYGICLTSICALALLLWSMGIADGAGTAVGLAFIGTGHAVVGFLRLGGRRLSAGGVLLFGMALFGYFPTIWYWIRTAEVPINYEIPGLALMLGLQVVWVTAWMGSSAAISDAPGGPLRISPGLAALALFFAGLCMVAGIGIQVLQIGLLAHLAQPFGYAAVVLTAVTLVQLGSRIRMASMLILGLLFALFAVLFFTGGGRLVLGSLAVGLALTLGFRKVPLYLKPLMVIVLPAALWVLARDRSLRTVEYIQGYRESGLESVVWPQRMFFQLMDSVVRQDVELGQGSTFAAASVIWVPRDVWPDKPVGFGTVLTELYKPHLLDVGHSEAGLIHGEFIYNFGLLGLLVVGVLVAGLVILYDRLIQRAYQRDPDGLDALASQAIAITLVAGLLDLVWVGTFTYVSRAGFTCFILLMLYVAGKILRSLDLSATTASTRSKRSGMSGPRVTRKRSSQMHAEG